GFVHPANGARSDRAARLCDEAPKARIARREKSLRKSESRFSRRGVSVQGGDEDALSSGADQTQNQPIDDRDPEADRETNDSAEGEPDQRRQQSREREQDDDHSQREVSARGLAPRLSQQRSAPL